MAFVHDPREGWWQKESIRQRILDSTLPLIPDGVCMHGKQHSGQNHSRAYQQCHLVMEIYHQMHRQLWNIFLSTNSTVRVLGRWLSLGTMTPSCHTAVPSGLAPELSDRTVWRRASKELQAIQAFLYIRHAKHVRHVGLFSVSLFTQNSWLWHVAYSTIQKEVHGLCIYDFALPGAFLNHIWLPPKADRCWGELHCLKDWGTGRYGQMIPDLVKTESPWNVCGVLAAGVVGRAAPGGWTLVLKP